MNNKLYQDIENLIIAWSNNGTKTAGTLTRQIEKLINKNFSLIEKYPERDCSVYINKRCNCKEGQCDNLMY